MSYRIAKSLDKLRSQVNELAPNRSKVSDGWIGDQAHATTASDHNPNASGVVTALDITHDSQGGVDCNTLAESLVKSRDSRIKYIIWNRRILSRTVSPWQWRNYTGKNGHTHHLHISVEGNYDDTREWNIEVAPSGSAPTSVPSIPRRPLLREGSRGEEVKQLQTLLKVGADGIFGPITKAAVINFQKNNDLVPDGIVGPYTWEKLAS